MIMKRIYVFIVVIMMVALLCISCAKMQEVIDKIRNARNKTAQRDTMLPDPVAVTASAGSAVDWDEVEIGYWVYKDWRLSNPVVDQWIKKHGADLVSRIKALPPSTTIVINGYACAIGPQGPIPGYERKHPGNEEISRRRANNIKKWLVQKTGLDDSRFTVTAHGEHDLKLPDKPKSQENRRVVITVE